MTTLYSVLTALTFFIMPAKTTLYDADLRPIVELPAGYFVLQTDSAAPDGYISVAYDDLSGLVKATAVTQTDYTPVTKYETTVRFTCDNDGQPVNLRAYPQRSAEVVAVLSPSESGHCYGTLEGDTLIDGAGNVWYYVRANGIRGYCYRAHVRVDPTPPNIIEKEPPPDVPTTVEPQEEPEEQNLPRVAVIIFIVALCIPVPFIMYYLFKKPKPGEED